MRVFLHADVLSKEMFNSQNLTESYNQENGKDLLFDEAAKLMITHKEESTSQLQYNFPIGFNRADRLVIQLEHADNVIPFKDTLPR